MSIFSQKVVLIAHMLFKDNKYTLWLCPKFASLLGCESELNTNQFSNETPWVHACGASCIRGLLLSGEAEIGRLVKVMRVVCMC